MLGRYIPELAEQACTHEKAWALNYNSLLVRKGLSTYPHVAFRRPYKALQNKSRSYQSSVCPEAMPKPTPYLNGGFLRCRREHLQDHLGDRAVKMQSSTLNLAHYM